MATPSSSLIPVTILTGFLGSGKTTLLNRILQEQHGHKIAVIENEFGEEGIDNDLLLQERGEQIVEMNNGCICCTVRGDLVRILGELRDKRTAGTLNFERVIIETTGVAKPGPVAQTFFMDEDISKAFILDAILTVVDAKHGQQQLDAQEEAREQVGFADRILLSKTDLVSDEEQAELRHRLLHMNPRAPIRPVHFGDTPVQEILDIRGFNLNAVLDIDPEFLHDEEHAHGHAHAHTHEHGPHCDHDHGDHVHDEHCGHDHAHHHHVDDIQSFVFLSDKPFDAMRLEEFMGGLTQVYGQDMLRYKGILYLKGNPRRLIFQGVHMMMGADLGRPWAASEKRCSKMVFIGRKLPQDIFLKGLQNCLAKK
ncbi:MAG: GTP-binding protein [Burkholderiaceae bacterium]|nr:MAG: GTP-binding protein [Burkholderiaceae bacterium]